MSQPAFSAGHSINMSSLETFSAGKRPSVTLNRLSGFPFSTVLPGFALWYDTI